MRPRPLPVVVLFLLVGAGLGFLTRRHPVSLFHHQSVSLENETWSRLSPERKKAISAGHKRFIKMTAPDQQMIRDRWQYYRHLPAWRQEQMLRDFERWRQIHPDSQTLP